MSDEGFEQKYIVGFFDTNWVISLGPNVCDDDVKYIIDTIKSAIIG